MSESTDDPTSDPPGTRSRKRTGCGAALLVLLALLMGAGGIAYWLWSTEPAYVAENRAFLRHTSEADLEAMAAGLENRISRRLTALPHDPATGSISSDGARPESEVPHSSGTSRGPSRPGARDDPGRESKPTSFDELQRLARQSGTREIEMTVREVNAWLATRSQKWLANEGLSMPEQVSDPMIAIEGDRLVVGFNFSEGDFSQWVSLSLDVDATATGQATVRLAGVRGGRLPLPARRALERGEGQLADRVDKQKLDKVRDALDGKPVEARVQLDERLATLVDFEVEGDRVTAIVRVEPMTEATAEAAKDVPGL